MISTAKNHTRAKESTIWALAQQDPGFAAFYAQYQEQMTLASPLPAEFVDAVITAMEKDPALSARAIQYQENAQAAMMYGIPALPELGVLIAALFLLSTHIKVHRTKDGRWEFLIEHKASGDGALEKIAQILSNLFQK